MSSNTVVIRTGEYRDEIDEIEVFGPFTEKEAEDFQDELERQSIITGHYRATRLVTMSNQLPPKPECCEEEA